MAIALLPERTETAEQPGQTATLAILCTPIRGADGALRTLRHAVDAGQPVDAVLPSTFRWDRVILNGGLVPPDAYPTLELLPGDEVLAIPRWGYGTEVFLIPLAVGLVLSIASTALSYVLFPPPRAHNIKPPTQEEPTFSFEGIRTQVGPGAVVPVIYGRQRTGGQLLSSSVDQTLTVLDDGVSSRRITAISAPATLSLLLALGEGPVSAIDPNTIQINGQPRANFPGLQVWTNLGSGTQAPLPTFGETANTFADGRLIEAAPSSIIYTTTAPAEAFVLNIVFNSGLYAFSPRGEKVDNNVTLQYRFRQSPAGSWVAWSSYDVVANRTSVVRFGIRRENLPLAVWDIEVQMTFISSTTNAEGLATLESVTEIQRNTQSYPFTALLGLRAIATDTLQGALPNVTVEVQGRLVRVDTFTSLDTWSDNPAWCVMDFLTHRRYGLGIPDSQIDLGAFQVWAAYCNQMIDGEKRHLFNYTLDRDARAQQVLLEMCGGSRTLLFKSEGLWTARPTRDDPPVMLLSWANCTDLKITYTRDADRVNVIEARFANETEDFEQDVLTWPTLENWPPDVRKTSIEVRGVTKPSRVMRAMQFELNRRRFENLSLEVTCNLEAVPLQPHDLFRFSHPLPGWGTSGRIQPGSSQSFLQLDQEVTFSGLHSYIVYVRHQDGSTEVKPVSWPGDVTARTLTLLAPLVQVPVPRTSLWAFGFLLPPVDTAVKLFRVIKMQRTGDNRVRIQAMVHNPSIYDEPTAEPLPIITALFNPLGPPPPITSLIASQVVRVQSSGASMLVVNLSWDVGGLGPGLAPYGGAVLFRRTVFQSTLAGSAVAGVTPMGQLQASTDLNTNYVPLTQVSGHVLDFDDYTVVAGVTYVYRVVPISSRGVPNFAGSREVAIHVSGPTTPDFFPGTALNLRLKGQPVGVLTFEGRDAHFEWDPIPNSGLFSETFFVQDYIVEIWAPAQMYLMRRTAVSARGPGVVLEYSYTIAMNAEDQIAAGQPGARRDFAIYVWARTNTGRVSLQPATITVSNPPPDMGDMAPTVQVLFEKAQLSFDQFVEPRDFDHYQINLDTVSPPLKIYNNVAIAFSGVGSSFRKVALDGLLPNVTYYVYVTPFDTFGPGIPTHTVSFVPVPMSAESLDTTPPEMPTGLLLTTGSDLSSDGTVMTWVRASWQRAPENDVAGYEVHVFIGDSLVPTVYNPTREQYSIQFPVPGNITVRVKLLAFDRTHNISGFTAEATITTGGDTVPPAAPSTLTAIGSIKSIALLWTPPADLDYAYSQVWAASTNDRAGASVIGQGAFSFLHEGLGPTDTYYYWLRGVDTSGNESVNFYPVSATAGVIGTSGQLDTTYLSSLAADKILAGHIQALVHIGVGNNLALYGQEAAITVFDNQVPQVLRVLIGKLGALSNQWGMQIFDQAGVLMWNFTTGATEAGISNAAITAPKIRVGALIAEHLDTNTLFIRGAAQIANALIDTAHIKNAAITTALIQDGQITTAKIGIAQVGTISIANAAIIDAHIQNLSANKITAGSLQVLLQLGVGPQLFLDGPNANIYVYDQQAVPVLRAMFGKLGAGILEYGLQIWDPNGQLMWDFNGGATSRGLMNSAVTTPKITANAVTGTLQHVVTSELIFASFDFEVIAGNMTFGTLLSGDVVQLIASFTVNILDGNRITVRLRMNSFTGPILATRSMDLAGGIGKGMVALHAVYGAASTELEKIFFLTVQVDFSQASIQDMTFSGMRLQR